MLVKMLKLPLLAVLIPLLLVFAMPAIICMEAIKALVKEKK